MLFNDIRELLHSLQELTCFQVSQLIQAYEAFLDDQVFLTCKAKLLNHCRLEIAFDRIKEFVKTSPLDHELI